MDHETLILLVDDHPLFRQGLSNLLESQEGLKVVGEANDGQMALEMVDTYTPDVVVMDITMPNLDGIEATRRILSKHPDIKIIAMSIHSGKQFINKMLGAGVVGYILKESVPEEMVRGIRTVLAGDVYLSKGISDIVVSEYRKLVTTETISSTEPILVTKLHPPPISADIIPRPELIETLENGRHRALTIISAPAGYGKSILASQWLQTSESPGVWISLDENDNDPRMFLTYLLDAVQRAFPTEDFKTRSLLDAPHLLSTKFMIRHLLNDIDLLDEPFILVLDDYSQIHNIEIHDLITELLRYPSPMLHTVILTRYDPPLPLSHLRVHSQLTEIRMDLLRFTRDETLTFLERHLHSEVQDTIVEILDKKLEGWITGLWLAVLSLRQKGDLARLLEGFEGDSFYFINEYLMHEVVSNIPSTYARFLFATSILDRFCAQLCDALMVSQEITDDNRVKLVGQDFIDWLIQNNLFCIPLDSNKYWYRYHHVFRDLLQKHLTEYFRPEEIKEFHLRSGEWFTDHGSIEEALRHVIAAGEFSRAVQIFWAYRNAMLDTDKWYLLEKVINLFPDELQTKNPEIMMTRAWIYQRNFSIDLLPPILDEVEMLIKTYQDEHPLRGEISFLRGFAFYLLNDGARSLQHLQDALQHAHVISDVVRGQAEQIFALAAQMEGQEVSAVSMLHDQLNSQPPPTIFRRTRLLSSMVYVHIISTNLDEALSFNQKALDFIADKDIPYVSSWFKYLKGLIRYYRNELDAAVTEFLAALENRFVLHPRMAVDCYLGLALSQFYLGKTEQADAALDSLFEFVKEKNIPAVIENTSLCRLRLLIAQRKREAVVKGLRENKIPEFKNMMIWLFTPVLTYCRGLILDGSDKSLKEAGNKLSEALKINESNHNTCHTIEILVLLSVVYLKQNRMKEALGVLEKAVILALPGGMIRFFVEMGKPMADILEQLREKTKHKVFIDKVLAAFTLDKKIPITGPSIQAGADSAFHTAAITPPWRKPVILDPLTNRELDILELIAQRLQTKEIAELKNVAPTTVKTHIRNIFQKLNARNRHDAVEIARGLGII